MTNLKASSGQIDQSGDFNFTGDFKVKDSPIVVSVSGIKNLVVPTVTGQSFSVTGFYSGTTVGGGNFVYDASKDKADHNGGTVIAPEAIAAWDGSAANIATLLGWTGAGVGCFVRSTPGKLITLDAFGWVDGADASLQINKMGGYSIDCTGVSAVLSSSIISDVSLIGGSFNNTNDIAVSGSVVITGTEFTNRSLYVTDGGSIVISGGAHFYDCYTNGITVYGGGKLSADIITGNNVGTSESLDPTSQGMLVGVFESNDDTDVRVGEMRADSIYGQGAIFGYRSRNVFVGHLDVKNTAYRGASFFGTTATSEPLNIRINSFHLEKIGALQTSGSAVGCNGIYNQQQSNNTANREIDFQCRNGVIVDCEENGFEGSGTYENITIKGTGTRNLTSPSKEGFYVTDGAVVNNIIVEYARTSGFKISPSCRRLNFNDVTVLRCEHHGMDSNNSTSSSYTRDKFTVENVNIVSHGSLPYLGVFIRDTSSGVTTYTSNAFMSNVKIKGRKIYAKTFRPDSVLAQVASSLPNIDRVVPKVVASTDATSSLYIGDDVITLGGSPLAKKVVTSGTPVSRSAIVSVSNGNQNMTYSSNTLVVGDVVTSTYGSDSGNPSPRRWTVIDIDTASSRIFFDFPFYGATDTALVLSTAPAVLV